MSLISINWFNKYLHSKHKRCIELLVIMQIQYKFELTLTKNNAVILNGSHAVGYNFEMRVQFDYLTSINEISVFW